MSPEASLKEHQSCNSMIETVEGRLYQVKSSHPVNSSYRKNPLLLFTDIHHCENSDLNCGGKVNLSEVNVLHSGHIYRQTKRLDRNVSSKCAPDSSQVYRVTGSSSSKSTVIISSLSFTLLKNQPQIVLVKQTNWICPSPNKRGF